MLFIVFYFNYARDLLYKSSMLNKCMSSFTNMTIFLILLSRIHCVKFCPNILCKIVNSKTSMFVFIHIGMNCANFNEWLVVT